MSYQWQSTVAAAFTMLKFTFTWILTTQVAKNKFHKHVSQNIEWLDIDTDYSLDIDTDYSLDIDYSLDVDTDYSLDIDTDYSLDINNNNNNNNEL